MPSDPKIPRGFGLHTFKRNPEIIPLVGIMGVAMLGMTAFSVYALMSKTDVKLNRSGFSRWEKIDINQPQKLLTFNQRYGENPNITSLKEELTEAYKGK